MNGYRPGEIPEKGRLLVLPAPPPRCWVARPIRLSGQAAAGGSLWLAGTAVGRRGQPRAGALETGTSPGAQVGPAGFAASRPHTAPCPPNAQAAAHGGWRGARRPRGDSFLEEAEMDQGAPTSITRGCKMPARGEGAAAVATELLTSLTNPREAPGWCRGFLPQSVHPKENQGESI